MLFASAYLDHDVLLSAQMDYIAGSFYDGFLLYAMALEETLAEGGAQNDGISITMKMQNRRIWGKKNLFQLLVFALEFFRELKIVLISTHFFLNAASSAQLWSK